MFDACLTSRWPILKGVDEEQSLKETVRQRHHTICEVCDDWSHTINDEDQTNQSSKNVLPTTDDGPLIPPTIPLLVSMTGFQPLGTDKRADFEGTRRNQEPSETVASSMKCDMSSHASPCPSMWVHPWQTNQYKGLLCCRSKRDKRQTFNASENMVTWCSMQLFVVATP